MIWGWLKEKKQRETIFVPSEIAVTGDVWSTRAVSVGSIEDRINLIREKIHEGKRDPLVHQVVSEILTTGGNGWVPPRNALAEISAIFDFVQKNIRYTRDAYGEDTFKRARRVLQLQTGDCDDMSILIGSMLQAVGYPVALKVVSVSGGDYDHIYPMVGVPPRSPERWVPLDASVPKPAGWEVPARQVAFSKIFEV